jgi:von Willebrand factor type A domain
VDVHVMFLIDKSGSMEGAIEQSKEALSRILAGFAPDKVHIATFDTMGTVLKPKAASRSAVQHMLGRISASGGTVHGAAVRALHQAGVRVPAEAKLVVIVAGDEAGEEGGLLANTFRECGYPVAGLGLICAVASSRGTTVRACAQRLGVSFTEVDVGQFDDPYQVPRVLQALLEAPVPTSFPAATVPRISWVDKVMQTPLLRPDGRPEARP